MKQMKKIAKLVGYFIQYFLFHIAISIL